MANEEPTTAGVTPETVTHAEPPQAQLRIEDSTAVTTYSTTAQIAGSAEEIILGFSQGVRPTNQPNVAVLKIDTRVILSPYAAKRLALALGQTVQRYEQAYGVIEIDPRKRLRAQPTAPNTTRAS